MKKIKLEDNTFVTSGKAFILALLFFIILSFLFSGCKDPKQIIYEGKGLTVTEIKLGDKPERGKYIYYTKDHTGIVIIWSDSKFKIGDILRFETTSKNTIN